ncbi:hypothetical protein QTP88_004208 [Uroleucon formosanum]
MASTPSTSRDDHRVHQTSTQQPKENNDLRLNDILVALTNVTQTLANITARMGKTWTFLKIRNYQTYITLHPNNKARGDSAVIIKESIKHYGHEKYSENHIQATSVIVNDGINNLIFTAIYCLPQGREIKLTEFFPTLGTRFIARGDYNSKNTHWNSRLIAPKGSALLKAASNINADIISTINTTYWQSDQNKIPDLLRYIL